MSAATDRDREPGFVLCSVMTGLPDIWAELDDEGRQAWARDEAAVNAELTAELSRLRARNEELDARCGVFFEEIFNERQRKFAALARVSALEEALLDYGDHRASCPALHNAAGKCDCGWLKVRSVLGGDERMSETR